MKQDSSHTDKWDILLDLLENPTAYSETQKNEILGDEETLEMYRQIVNVHQALDSQKKDEEIHLPSMDEEWEKLKEKKLGNMGIEQKAIHLAYHSFQTSSSHDTNMAKEETESKDSVRLVTTTVQKTSAVNDSVSTKLPLLFEDMELQAILQPIAQHFNVQVVYKNESSRHIRLYLQLTEQMSLNDIIEQMNHFEKVNIHSEGKTLIVE